MFEGFDEPNYKLKANCMLVQASPTIIELGILQKTYFISLDETGFRRKK